MRSKLVGLLAAAIIGLAGSFVVVAVSATPVQADACYTWNRVLKRGMSGSDVAQLQIRIAGWMTYGTNLVVDGAFGPATEGALKRFQQGYGLTVDGIAGSQTYSKIYSLQSSDCTPINFSHSEFNYNCGARNYNGGNVSATQARENMKRVMWQLQALRRKLGDRPIVISSGFRSVSCDKAVGGSGSGRHTYAQAADMSWRSGPTLCQMASAARYAGFEGIFGPGYPGHNDHTHADNRASRAWSAPNCGI